MSTNLNQLRDAVDSPDYSLSIDAISNGAIGLLDEVASGKITGEEETWSRDPRTQFVRIQESLAGHDAMNEYTRHIGSAIFAIPPEVERGSYVGASLFGS